MHGGVSHARGSGLGVQARPADQAALVGQQAVNEALLGGYLKECSALVREEIERWMPKRADRERSALYTMMLDYPLRSAKSLRPALCIAVCRALGGSLSAVLPSAAVLELFHNAFLVHDDIEDESLLRRGLPTLHQAHGVPIAINVGDAMLALCLSPLLENTRIVGLGKALRVMEVVARMARESVEGQASELDWVRGERWEVSERDYLRMVLQKTGWYTFVAPVLMGAIVAGGEPRVRACLRRMAVFLGLGFQIIDDVLNLEADEARYGKEIGGDLAEGKRTLILLHALREATAAERAQAEAVLRRPRQEKSPDEIAWLLGLIRGTGSLGYARGIARRYAQRARGLLGQAEGLLGPSVHRAFLHALVDYVVERER